MDVVWHLLLLAATGASIAWLVARRRAWGMALLFGWIAAVATYPLVFSLDRLPANAPAANDAYLFLWDLWWVKTALARGTSPLFCDFLFAPHGTTLVFHGLALPQALATLPLQALGDGLAGLVLAYDAVVLGSFWLAGWATWRLALRITGSEWGAAFAGVAFTLQSLHFASTVRFHALAIEWLPLFFLGLLGALERGRVRDGLLTGLAFVGAFYASIEYAYFLVLGAAVVVGLDLLRDESVMRRPSTWRDLALGLVPPLLLTAPFWWAFAVESRLTHGALAADAVRLSPDLLDLFLPDPRHSLLGGAIGDLREGLGLAPVPTAVAVSWTLAALAICGAVRSARARDLRMLPWALLALGFAAFTLGPVLHVAGRDTGLAGPYTWVAAVLPFFEQARMPMRFGAMAQLGLAILAARGIAELGAGREPRRVAALGLAAIALVGFEALRWPLETAPPRVPEAYARVAELSPLGGSALLDWPAGVGEAAEVEGLHQIVHGQKLVQDLPLFLPRAARETRRTATGPELRGLFRSLLGSDALGAARGKDRERLVRRERGRLAELGVEHVVLRRRELPAEVYARGRANLERLEPSHTYEDEDAFLASFVGP
ncbi:MAG: hypothetical protein ACQGVK_00095 [Myxococcota bacterium]